MTDYAPAAAAEPSWTWWMTTAAAAAMRMRNLRDHHTGGVSDTEDDFAGPDRKRQRVDDVKDECWTGTFDGGSHKTNDSGAAGPLDLSVKATLTAAAHVINGREGSADKYTVTTPVKKSRYDNGNGKSSKKAAGVGKTTTATSMAAVKAATRKLLPQLLQTYRVDRSSPVSGTIIVPANTVAQGSSSPDGYAVSAEVDKDSCDKIDSRDDDYDGGDIDPEFNVVVATDEARRRLESIPNTLGPYLCRLCNVRYVDAFALARHRCRCIVHVRYRCPECDKVFQCPANLASHRRWHGTTAKASGGNKNNNNVSVKLDIPVETPQTGTGTAINNNDDCTSITTTNTATVVNNLPVAIPSAAGFKKNILQRAVQAAAAAAAKDCTSTPMISPPIRN